MATAAQKRNKLNGTEFDANSKNLMFPSDLLSGEGQDQLCMTLFINTIRNGQAKLSFMGGLSTPKNKLASAYGEVPVIHTVSRGLQGQKKINVFSNTFVRSDVSITLPMPKNLNFNSSVKWSNTDLGAAAMAIDQGDDFAKTMEGGKGLATQIALNTVGSIASQFAKGAIKGKELVELGTATVANNYAETLFKSVDNRTFTFNYTLTPRNQKEAQAIENILRVLRFHQLPEFKENVGNGNAFMLYPSSFDIAFWLEGQPNRFIPRISTCALTGIETNYAPGGNGYIRMVDGSPQSYTLTLNFAELSVLHKGMVGEDSTGTNTTF